MSFSYKIFVYSPLVDGTTNKLFYALYNAEIIGSVNAIDWEKEGTWLNWMFVHEDYRKMGIGSALINFVSAYAYARGKTGIDLSVRTHNIIAQDMYKKLGFVLCYEADGNNLVFTKHLAVKEAAES